MRRPDLTTLAVDVLAIHRLTRLVTADTITQPVRARLIRSAYELRDGHLPMPADDTPDAAWDAMPENDDDAPKLAAFVRCRWCTGLWISGFVVAARRYAPRVWEPLARALAGSTAAALLAGLEDS